MLKFEELERQEFEEKRTQRKASIIGKTVHIKGELSNYEDIIIEGTFEGKIETHNRALIVETEARIHADIWANDITIKGKVKGNLYAAGKVLIENIAQMDGNITASKISIMEGAQFKGSVRMKNSAQKRDKI